MNQGETALWDGRRAAADTQKIVEQNLRLWGSLPYEKYVFLNLIVDSGGGLEHKNSVTMMTGRYATRTHKSYLGWLGLVSHEYFHAWNVKRLRPRELGPFDYENEVYTQNLWVAEGFTDYYSGLQVRRAGLATDAEYLGVGAASDIWSDSLSAHIEALQTTPGRLTQPVGMASYDAWIKAYRPDENSVNTAISYYTKGSVIAWLLDAKLRHSTAGRAGLDDLMRLAYQRYSGERGYDTAEFVAAASEIAGADLQAVVPCGARYDGRTRLLRSSRLVRIGLQEDGRAQERRPGQSIRRNPDARRSWKADHFADSAQRAGRDRRAQRG